MFPRGRFARTRKDLETAAPSGHACKGRPSIFLDTMLGMQVPRTHDQAPVFNVFVGCDLEPGGVGGVADRWELSHDGGKRTCYLRPTQGPGGVTRPSVTCQTSSICARVAASCMTVFPATTGIVGMPVLPRSVARRAARSTL